MHTHKSFTQLLSIFLFALVAKICDFGTLFGDWRQMDTQIWARLLSRADSVMQDGWGRAERLKRADLIRLVFIHFAIYGGICSTGGEHGQFRVSWARLVDPCGTYFQCPWTVGRSIGDIKRSETSLT